MFSYIMLQLFGIYKNIQLYKTIPNYAIFANKRYGDSLD